MKLAKRAKQGVTLVEIAIVLVIIGLLLGGILKGQELINNAKVKNMIGYQEALRGSWYAFIDRYEAIPGDWTRANQFLAINESAVISGQGDGFINEHESPLVFTHLVAAGFIRCAVCDDGVVGHAAESEWSSIANNPGVGSPTGELSRPTPENSPTNSYGGVVAIFHDVNYYHGRTAGNNRAQLMAHSGPRVPSNLARDVDNKIDDGYANSGDVRMNNFSTQEGGGSPATARDVPGDYVLSDGDIDSCVGDGIGGTGDLVSTSGQQTGSVGTEFGELSTPSYPWRIASASGGPTHANCGFSVRL